MSLREEAIDLLQELIRLDTVNPPGNETAAANLLREYLESNGVACETHARVAERANLVARLPGGDGPTLALLSHTDTVLADAASWSVDPWSGELRDGHVWGRGALDMKGQVAASAVAIASLAREGFEPRGELVFAATADEEVGEDPDFGLSWLVRAHPEAVRCDFALNEGGGDRIEIGGRVLYLAAVAEKASSPFTLRVRGRSGHGSQPHIADNALVKAAPLVEMLGAFSPTPRVIPEVAAFLRAIGVDGVTAEDAVARAREIDEFAAEIVEPLLGFTVAPTMITASQKRNVVPAVVEVTVDTRLLPGQTQDEAEAAIRERLGDGAYEIEWRESQGGTRSPSSGALWGAVSRWVGDVEPGAALAPVCLSGFTDSHWLREAYGTVCYGFFPMRAMAPDLAARLVHSDDERVHVDDLVLGTRFLREAAIALLV